MSGPSKGAPLRAPRTRLDTLRSTRRPGNRFGRQNQKPAPQCANPNCTRSDVVEDDGKLICRSCGYVLSDVQITQELTFGEASNGAAVVQGVFVGANEENARSSAMGPSKLTGGMDSRQVTERNGQHHINSLVAALRLSATQKERAYLMWTLAMNQNFIQGRVTKHVAAVCLYIACRHDSECRLMLVDFSDLLEMNVFKLGQIYTAFMEALHISDNGINLGLVNPENLIHRFAQELEFGADEHKIANEAVQVLKRLDRDWITTGRRPAGVCAAALILAARMNNYRRTVREVIYTAKVCEITINKRLDEFRNTDSSKLTVEEFRHHGEDLAAVHDPPAFYQQFEQKKAGRRSKQVAAAEGSPEGNNDQDREASPPSDGNDQSDSVRSKKAKRDNAAMPPPPPPVDPALLSVDSDEHLLALAHAEGADAQDSDEDEDDDEEVQTVAGQKRKRPIGRPLGSKNKPLPQLAAKDISDESMMEKEVQAILEQPEIKEQATATHQSLKVDRADAVETEKPSQERQEEAPSVDPLDAEIISESEFADDPEVMNVKLSEEEKRIKEQIWVHANGDYLRAYQARQLKRDLALSAGTARIPKKRTRTKPRLGDTTHYQAQRDEHGNIIGTSSPAESVKMMLSHRGYSKKLDYATVEKLYNRYPSRSPSVSARSPSERRSTRAPSEVSEQASPSKPPPKLRYQPVARPGTSAAAMARAAGGTSRQAPIVIEDAGGETSEDESDDEEAADGDVADLDD